MGRWCRRREYISNKVKYGLESNASSTMTTVLFFPSIILQEGSHLTYFNYYNDPCSHFSVFLRTVCICVITLVFGISKE